MAASLKYALSIVAISLSTPIDAAAFYDCSLASDISKTPEIVSYSVSAGTLTAHFGSADLLQQYGVAVKDSVLTILSETKASLSAAGTTTGSKDTYSEIVLIDKNTKQVIHFTLSMEGVLNKAVGSCLEHSR